MYNTRKFFVFGTHSRFFLLLLLSSMFMHLSCQKDELKPGFEMPYVAEFTIPPGINAFDTHYFYIRDIPSGFQTYLNQQALSDSSVIAISTQRAFLSGIFGDENFDFVQEVSLRVFEERDPNDWIEIAYRLPVPLSPGAQLDLIPSLADSRTFFVNPRFSLAVVLRLRRSPTEETPARINLIMRSQIQ